MYNGQRIWNIRDNISFLASTKLQENQLSKNLALESVIFFPWIIVSSLVNHIFWEVSGIKLFFLLFPIFPNEF